MSNQANVMERSMTAPARSMASLGGGDLWAMANAQPSTFAKAGAARGGGAAQHRLPRAIGILDGRTWRGRATVAAAAAAICIAAAGWQVAGFFGNGPSGPSAEALKHDLPFQLPGD